MQSTLSLEVQGHRGALGLLPENTLPSFEIALDLGVHSIETDVLLTRDHVPVLFHDFQITDRICSVLPGHSVPSVAVKPLMSSLTLGQLHGYRINADTHLPMMPLALRFAEQKGIHPYGIPTLAELLEFVLAYGGALGEDVGKTPEQRACANRVIVDLELKRVPFLPQTIGDGFSGTSPALLEESTVAAVRRAELLPRTRVRSFDHRSVRAVKQLEPSLQTALLIYYTAPAQIALLLEAAHAELYCPDYQFVDAEIVGQVHAAGKRIMPYTVNEPAEWQQLVAWGVDGITTDFPDRLLHWIAARFSLDCAQSP